MIKPQDLSGSAREAYDTWRELGLTEAAALNAVIEDGHVQLSDHDRLARNFRTIFGLSEQAAEDAARGRDGRSSSRPVSETRQAAAPAPVEESGLAWHLRVRRELADLDRMIQETKAMQEERWRREDEAKINRERKQLGLPPVDLDRYR